MRESRLFQIIYYILEKGRATAPELAEKFEVSVRTIYRDVDAISSAGIPVYVSTGRNGGIQILDGYILEKVLFSEQEKQDLLSALKSLSLAGSAYEKELLTKLSALFQTNAENWFEVDFSRWNDSSQDDSKFELLKDAIIHHKSVAIVYVNSRCEKATRKIHPLKLFYKSMEWYVKAYCTEKQDFRLFKLNRIVSCELLEESFTPISFPDLQKEALQPSEKFILRFPPEMAYRVYDEFHDSEIALLENGELLVTTYMPNDVWLIGYLLSFGSRVFVVEPAHLRKLLAKEGKKIYKNNKP